MALKLLDGIMVNYRSQQEAVCHHPTEKTICKAPSCSLAKKTKKKPLFSFLTTQAQSLPFLCGSSPSALPVPATPVHSDVSRYQMEWPCLEHQLAVKYLFWHLRSISPHAAVSAGKQWAAFSRDCSIDTNPEVCTPNAERCAAITLRCPC